MLANIYFSFECKGNNNDFFFVFQRQRQTWNKIVPVNQNQQNKLDKITQLVYWGWWMASRVFHPKSPGTHLENNISKRIKPNG